MAILAPRSVCWLNISTGSDGAISRISLSASSPLRRGISTSSTTASY